MKIFLGYSAPVSTGIFLLLTFILLNGCTLVPPIKPSAMTTYNLDIDFEPVSENSGELILRINTPKVLSGLNSSRMVYIEQAHEINYFSQNQWIDSPARMLAPLLVQALEHRGKYRAVVNMRSASRADIRLDTDIIRFQHEFITRPSQVHLTIRAQLFDLQGKSVIATREFDVIETATADTPYGGVLATNSAVKKILQQIAEFSAQESQAGKLKKLSE